MIRPFTTLSGIAAPLPLANVDTDKIVPARFLKTVERRGLGKALFHAMRYGDDGRERDDFVLNREPWRHAAILVTRDNFGCGSSREHAPWALADFGITCLIAPGFADIFHSNCFKNGILPIALPGALVERLLAVCVDPTTSRFEIDLVAQTIEPCGGEIIHFAIDPGKRQALLEGHDDIDATLLKIPAIAAHDAAVSYARPSVPLSIGS